VQAGVTNQAATFPCNTHGQPNKLTAALLDGLLCIIKYAFPHAMVLYSLCRDSSRRRLPLTTRRPLLGGS